MNKKLERNFIVGKYMHYSVTRGDDSFINGINFSRLTWSWFPHIFGILLQKRIFTKWYYPWQNICIREDVLITSGYIRINLILIKIMALMIYAIPHFLQGMTTWNRAFLPLILIMESTYFVYFAITCGLTKMFSSAKCSANIWYVYISFKV